MSLSPTIDKYLSVAERAKVAALTEAAVLYQKRMEIAKANSDICNSFLSTYNNDTKKFPDGGTINFVAGTKEILNYPYNSFWYGNGQWGYSVWRERDAMNSLYNTNKDLYLAKTNELDNYIKVLSAQYKVKVDVDAKALTEISIDSEKKGQYLIYAVVIAAVYFVYVKFIKK
jgi:hypothetical protein